MEKVRLDKWLWAARFYEPRSLAVAEVRRGRVLVNGATAKPAREIRTGDRLTIKKTNPPMQIVVQALSDVRSPAPVAQQLYEETPESKAERARAAELRRLAPEPEHSRHGRPTKRQRRQLSRFRRGR